MHKVNYKFIIQYDGSRYLGWQRLGGKENERTIQSILEEILSVYLKETIAITGSGRTDAGVHALGQVANCHSGTIVSPENMKMEVNQLLPEDVRIIQVEKVTPNFHSRYDATAKVYQYQIDVGEKQNVFTRKYTTHIPKMLDITNMEKAAASLIGVHDFKGFATSVKERANTIRELYEITFQRKGNQVNILFYGNGFLYNMVRIMAGTLVEVGLGKMSLGDVLSILEKKDRQLAGPTLSGQGLFLKKVFYEKSNL